MSAAAKPALSWQSSIVAVVRKEHASGNQVAVPSQVVHLRVRLGVHEVDPLSLHESVERVQVTLLLDAWEQIPRVHVRQFDVVRLTSAPTTKNGSGASLSEATKLAAAEPPAPVTRIRLTSQPIRSVTPSAVAS